ncbi:MAG TPA: M14 family metallopeptidase [Bacteroidales bacterium]|nr:M14 family metallopeptidase [Bacteroidales bacterium]
MRCIITVGLAVALNILSVKGQMTVAENSDFNSTSTHSEVMSFVSQLTGLSPFVRVDTLAMSVEGKLVPLLVIGDPLPERPEDLASDNRLVVYIQANIHAGEVEGKEASLMLARDLLKEHDPKYFRNLVILICPNLNPDGNDKISTRNRTNQNGPQNGVGVRYNGQMLDLNRDAMKLETPEMRGVITRIFNRWDPALTVDCHTTNGSYHEEAVTFNWMVNPNGDRNLINYMRDELCPAVSQRLKSVYGVDNIFYGEFIDFKDYSKGWESYASEPRYLVNYVGIRNRLGILNENYVYADYRTRVMGCYALLRSILDYSAENRQKIRELIRTTDEAMILRERDKVSADSFALEYKVRPTPEMVTIHAYEVAPNPEPNVWPYYIRTDQKVTVTVPFFADYSPTRSIAMPFGYALTMHDHNVLDLLQIQGIRFHRLEDSASYRVESFTISELKPSERLNQGHYTNKVTGEWKQEKRTFPPGTYVITTAQPLGNLAAYLLEPQSDDSMLLWNFFDRYLVPQWGRGYYPYPVYRIIEK